MSSTLDPAQLDRIVASQNIQIRLRPESDVLHFEDFNSLWHFFGNEVEFWAIIAPTISGRFNKIQTELGQAQARGDEAGAVSFIVSAISRANDTELLYSSTRQAKFLSSLLEKGEIVARAALSLFQDKVDNPGPSLPHAAYRNADGITGLVAGVLFKNPELISSPTAAEIAASEAQRAELNTVQQEFKTDFAATKLVMTEWMSTTQTAYSNTFAAAQAERAKLGEEVITELRQLHANSTENLTALAKTFQAQMTLQKPSEYWALLESTYLEQGKSWVWRTVIAVGLFAMLIGVVIYCPPVLITSPAASAQGVKGAILIAAVVSAFLYLTSLFVKLATSSFHLARDARERFQLTHVYLGLIKDRAIEDKDREIVLSALFSRADTGLLKGDSSPSPPTAIGSILEHLRGK